MIFLAPLAATLIQLAVSRSPRFADDTGAHWTGNPYALATHSAKSTRYSRRIPACGQSVTAHLFIIARFLVGKASPNLFSTHPPTAKRIERVNGRPAEIHRNKATVSVQL